MLFSILRGGYTPIEILVSVFALAFVIFCTMPVHEYAMRSLRQSSATIRRVCRADSLESVWRISWIARL